MLSISATAGSCPVIARSRRQSACLATHRFAAWRRNVVRWTRRRPGNRWPKWRRKWACRPRSVSRPRNSPTISTVSTSLSARTGAGPRWRSRHSRHRSRTKSSTTQNTAMMRVSRSMAATHEAALPQTNRRRASESYATSTARKNLHIGLASAAFWKDTRAAEMPAVVTIPPARLGHVLRTAGESGCELAIIDAPPFAKDIAFEAAQHADFILIPTRPAVLDVMAMTRTLELVRHYEKPAAVVLTFCPPQGREVSD